LAELPPKDFFGRHHRKIGFVLLLLVFPLSVLAHHFFYLPDNAGLGRGLLFGFAALGCVRFGMSFLFSKW
jgi:hypothetical protein